jgi:hypothetical protein
MRSEADSSRGGAGRWRQWRERRKLSASRRRAWAEDSLDQKNQERYRTWGRGGGGATGPDVGGGDGGGGL